jgi:methionine-rich copper-binding protein CopC/putative copper export protein
MDLSFWPRLCTLLRALFVIALPTLCFGHATPLQYIPEASSVLSRTPQEVIIHFSERVEPNVSSVIVMAPDGSRAELKGGIDDNDRRTYRVALKDAGPGTYTVSWKVISADDGHFAKGAYVFSVGRGTLATTAENSGFQTVHSSGVPEASTLTLELIGDALMLGAFVVFAWIWRPLRRHFPEVKSVEDAFARRFQIMTFTGGGMALAGGVAYLIYKTNELATLQEMSFGAAWGPFLTTTAARYTIYRLLGAALVLAASKSKREQILAAGRISKPECGIFAVLALIDLARARVSHAAASTFAPAFGVFMNFVHLLFKDVWIGGLIAFVILLLLLINQVKNLRTTAFALTAFSKIASVALGFAGTTGVYVVWLHLKSFSNLLTADWGKRFVVLSALACVLLALRLFHQLYVEPTLVKANRPGFMRKLGFTLPAEVAIGTAILAVTSLLIITTPPLAVHRPFLRSAVSQEVELSLTEHPYESGTFLVTVSDPHATADSQTVRGANSGSTASNMVVVLTNQAAGIGPIIAPVEQRFAGGYVFDEKLLTPAGEWTIGIAAQRTGAYDAAAMFVVKYPQEINEIWTHAGDRTFGFFDAIHICVALLLALASVILYRNSASLGRAILAAPDESTGLPEVRIARPIAWISPIVFVGIVLLLAGGFPALSSGILESDFQRSCEKANVMNVWHESVPMRAGNATTDLAVPGCTVGIGLGQYHFADAREFAFFERPSRARAQLAIHPEAITPDTTTTLTFTLRDAQGHPVQDLVLDHNRIMHVVIVSQDFSVFSHIHAEDLGPITPAMIKAAVFQVQYTFPKEGHYMISVDFTQRAYIFSDQFYVSVGTAGVMGSPGNADLSLRKKFDGYDVALTTSPPNLKAGAPATLGYHIEKDGKPFTGMNPYLAVPMHLSIVRDDLMQFLHTHGLLPVSPIGKLLGESIHASHLFLPNKFGPDVEVTNFSFAAPGTYHVFGEFSSAGKVVVTQFTVKVE